MNEEKERDNIQEEGGGERKKEEGMRGKGEGMSKREMTV